MKILQRHYLKEFFKLLGILSLGIATVFSLIDLIDKIDNFTARKLTTFDFFAYAAYNLPKYLYYLLPMSLLICSLFIFNQASRNRELIVLKASGARLKKIFLPFIFLGILFSLIGFVLGEIVVPYTSSRSLEIKKKKVKDINKYIFKEGTLWLKGLKNSLIKIDFYIPEEKVAKGVSIFINENSFLKQRIEAKEAQWITDKKSKGIWKLKQVTLYDIEKGTVSIIKEMDYPYLESPDFFSRGIKKPEDMGMSELYRYIKRLQTAGFKDTKLTVTLNSKLSYPLTSFFMLLIGMSLSVKSRVGGGLIAAGIGIFISFLYWLTYTLMLSMGYARVLHPILATWIVPILCGMIGIYLFKKIPE
jgi:lipopolysaccharide export system permease protein